MIYRFDTFELDTAKVELRAGGDVVAIEPQVFALLAFLIENRERMVSKDDLIEVIWEGRIVSDAAVASRIKSARQAIGDDGKAQRFIRTIHGAGFRFVGDVAAAGPASIIVHEPAPALILPQAPSSRPSIAVLPFRLVGVAGPASGIADALPDDLITELSRLRWLFVIARGSTFQLRGADAALENVRATLNVRYCLSGVVEVLGRTMTVAVELADTQDSGVVWGDRFRGEIDAVHEIREEIVRAVTSALELRIPLNEARLARLKSPDHLDAWSAYHLGLHHMYRFTKDDNALATAYFERAAKLEAGFARAYAGLSFTHFQDAFLRYSGDISESAKLAQAFAERALENDPMDPFSNFTKGRSIMLQGDLDGAIPWLERANTLSPNYAQAKYSRAWVGAMLGTSVQSRSDLDEAMALSPLDPFRYAMLGVRAFLHIVQTDYAAAAEWGERAAQQPNAHVLIDLIAVVGHGLNGDDASARARAESARARVPDIASADFFRAFRFKNEPARVAITNVLRKYGF
ncbi:MAG TPA: winged helix-turn-helix domain-containing protein [Caulobacterales bacterium]|nr:winged helix-turn-helix domain-containing protein [Caulobacterales bacterium]